MLQKIKDNQALRQVFDSHNIGLYLVAIMALSVTWSSVKAIQKNFELEKRINEIQLEIAIQEQENKNIALKNRYYSTDAYLDLAARKYLGKAAAGEKLVLVPRDIAQSYIHPPSQNPDQSTDSAANSIIENWQAWLKALTGQR